MKVSVYTITVETAAGECLVHRYLDTHTRAHARRHATFALTMERRRNAAAARVKLHRLVRGGVELVGTRTPEGWT